MFLGVAVFLLFFGIIAITQNGLFVIGIGVSVVLMVVPNLSRDVIKKRIPVVEKEKKVLDTIKTHDIIFLDDHIFDQSMNRSRILAHILTESVNLRDYEVIDERALVKKRLHLSPDLIRALSKINKFKNVSRFTSEMLMISASPALIRTRAYEDALAVPNNPIRSAKLFRAHKDRLMKADYSRAEQTNKRLDKAKKIFFVAGPLIFVAGMVLVVSASVIWVGIPLSGFFLLIVGIFLEIISGLRRERMEFFQKIIQSINRNRILSLNAECFDGLLPEQSIIIVKKLIECQKISGREIIGKTAIAAKSLKLTSDKLHADAEKARKKAFQHAAVINAFGPSLNCTYCGANIREGNKFCTFCGKPSKTVYHVSAKEKVTAKIKIQMDIPPDTNCDNCGSAFFAEETYCGYCGTMRKDIRRRI